MGEATKGVLQFSVCTDKAKVRVEQLYGSSRKN